MKLCILVLIPCGLVAMGRGESLREEFERFKAKSEREFEQFKDESRKVQEETMRIQEERFLAADKERKSLKEKLDALEASNTSAAFSVRLSEAALLTDSPLIYDIVNLNIGDGYNEFTGVFEPPIDGVYALTVYAIADGSNSGRMYIKRNDDILCETIITQSGGNDAGVCSAIAQLIVGDSVFVSGDGDMALIEGSWAGFTGHIISDALTA